MLQLLKNQPLPGLDRQGLWSAVIRPSLLLALSLGVLWSLSNHITREILREKTAADLQAIARLKTGQIEHWLNDRRDDTRIILTPRLIELLAAWQASGQQDEALAQRIQAQLSLPAGLHEARSYILRSATTGAQLLAASPGSALQAASSLKTKMPTGIPPADSEHGTAINSRMNKAAETRTEVAMDSIADTAQARQLARQAASLDQVVFEEMHFQPEQPAVTRSDKQPEPIPQSRIEMGYFTPLKTATGQPLGLVLHSRIDPRQVLFPLLQHWPGLSPSAETILAHRQLDHIVYLNELRHAPDSALKLSRPAHESLIAAALFQRGQGYIAALDYRNQPSFAYGLPVAGTPWLLVAKIDQAEVFQASNRLAFISGFLLLLLLFSSAAWLYRRRQKQLRLQLLLAEMDDLYQHAPCGYHSLDAQGIFQRINETELQMLGYQRDEVIGKLNFRTLLTPENQSIFDTNFPQLLAGKTFTDVALELIRKDGSHFPALVSASALFDASGHFFISRSLVYDMSSQRAAENALISSREQLRQLIRHDENIREAERKRMAAELHDELGQLLTALKMKISLLQMQFDHQPGLMELTEEMRTISEKTVAVVRHAASDLRPAALELGLIGALEWLAEETTRQTHLPCRMETQESHPCFESCLDEATTTTIFRIAQESLTNAVRHAQATQVLLQLHCQHGILRLIISDNGQGFTPANVRLPSAHFGLLAMQERAAALGGRLHIDSQPGAGCRIQFELPLQSSHHECSESNIFTESAAEPESGPNTASETASADCR